MITRTGDPCERCGGLVPIGGHTHSEVSDEERERAIDHLLAELERLGDNEGAKALVLAGDQCAFCDSPDAHFWYGLRVCDACRAKGAGRPYKEPLWLRIVKRLMRRR